MRKVELQYDELDGLLMLATMLSLDDPSYRRRWVDVREQCISEQRNDAVGFESVGRRLPTHRVTSPMHSGSPESMAASPASGARFAHHARPYPFSAS
jgi:hypothetical protein